MNNIKKVFSLGIVVLAMVVVFAGANKALAANTCTFTGATNNDWHTPGNWSGCGGILPQSADSVIIPTAKTVTMSGSSSITALTFNDPVSAASSLTLNGNTLTVSGATTYTATTGTQGSTITVDTGTFNTGSLSMNDGAGGGSMVLTVSSGNITVTGNVSGTFSTAAHIQFTSTGASIMTFGGNFPSGGTLTTSGTGTIVFNSAGSQNVGAYTTYNNVTKSGAGTATLLGTTTFGGNLIVSAGTLDTNSQTFTTTGTSNITGTILFSTGAKTFTGAVTLNSGAVWTESGASTFTFSDNLTNNATTFTSSTGLHTFSGTTKVISGATTTGSATTPITIGTGAYTNSGTISTSTLTVNTIVLTNSGTLTVATSLAGTGTLTQGAAGVLNLGGTSTISHMSAVTAGNTVNYTAAGAQTVFDPDTGTAHAYSNLTLSGSGAKTIQNFVTVIGAKLTISGTATATLSNSTSTANSFYVGTVQQGSGSWGAAASSATHKSDVYFTAAVNQLVTVTLGGTSSTGPTIYGNPTTTTTTPPVTPVTCTAPQVLNTTTNTCVTPTPTTTLVAGCTDTTGFSATTGASCSGSVTIPTVTGSYNFGTTVLKNGSHGDAVKELQRFLNDKLNLGLVLDGKLGPKTIAVIKKWQKANGLKADGLIGPKTKAMMNGTK